MSTTSGTDLNAVLSAAQQIGTSAGQLSQRISASSTELGTKGKDLAAVTAPSQSGAEAAGAVSNAQRALQDSCAALTDLESAINDFIKAVSQ